MRILYAIQGTGNGHISRARDIIPLLQQKGELDILISGTQADVSLNCAVKYRLKGLSFVFGKKGGINLLETFRKARLNKLLKEVEMLPVEEYDLVINDFEPVSAWACYLKNIPCYSLSHQAAVLCPTAPQPKRVDLVGKAVLKRYAPTKVQFGFHFSRYQENIFTPVIRQQVRQAQPNDLGHYTVYLPAYSEKRLIDVLGSFADIKWEVFSKHSLKPFKINNVHIYPIDNDKFLSSMVTASGVLAGAGFETPAEALFLSKKLLVIPMKGQYEQQCNAAALKAMGVPVVKSLKLKHESKIRDWIKSEDKVRVNYPDITSDIIDLLIEKYYQEIGRYMSLTRSAQVPDHSKPKYKIKNIAG